MLNLSEAGAELLTNVSPRVEDAQQIMLQGLNDDEAAIFMALLKKATTAVNELSRAPMRLP